MKIYIAFIIFFIGLHFCLNYTHKDVVENFNNYENYKPDPSIPSKCYNLLIQKGKELHLVNTKKAMIPGVNPINFKDLGEYIEYAKWQEKTNNECPILYFQQTYDAQGKRGYRLLDDPLNPQGGVKSELLHSPNRGNELFDANSDNKPFNQNLYSGYDQQDQYIGEKNILDDNFITAGQWNPMQSDWKGPQKSESQATEFKKDRSRSIQEINKPLYNPKINAKDRLDPQSQFLKSQNQVFLF